MPLRVGLSAPIPDALMQRTKPSGDFRCNPSTKIAFKAAWLGNLAQWVLHSIEECFLLTSFMANKYLPAIEQLKEIKRTYNTSNNVAKLRNHAKVVIRNYGDDKLIGHFHSMTNFSYYTIDEIRFEKLINAIDVAIRDFEIKNTEPNHTAVETAASGKRFDRLHFSFFYVVGCLLVIIASNYSTFKIGWFQIAIMALVPVAIGLTVIIKKNVDRAITVASALLTLALWLLDKFVFKEL